LLYADSIAAVSVQTVTEIIAFLRATYLRTGSALAFRQAQRNV